MKVNTWIVKDTSHLIHLIREVVLIHPEAAHARVSVGGAYPGHHKAELHYDAHGNRFTLRGA